jgi:hypothetical protein
MAFDDGWNQVCIPSARFSIEHILTAVLSSGADFVFIPERPPKVNPWEDEMCEIIQKVCCARCYTFFFFFL